MRFCPSRRRARAPPLRHSPTNKGEALKAAPRATPSASRKRAGPSAPSNARRGADAGGADRGAPGRRRKNSVLYTSNSLPRLEYDHRQLGRLQLHPARRRRPRLEFCAHRLGGSRTPDLGDAHRWFGGVGFFVRRRAAFREKAARRPPFPVPASWLNRTSQKSESLGGAGPTATHRNFSPTPCPCASKALWSPVGVDRAFGPRIKHSYRPAKMKPATADRSGSGGKAGGRKGSAFCVRSAMSCPRLPARDPSGTRLIPKGRIQGPGASIDGEDRVF